MDSQDLQDFKDLQYFQDFLDPNPGLLSFCRASRISWILRNSSESSLVTGAEKQTASWHAAGTAGAQLAHSWHTAGTQLARSWQTAGAQLAHC